MGPANACANCGNARNECSCRPSAMAASELSSQDRRIQAWVKGANAELFAACEGDAVLAVRTLLSMARCVAMQSNMPADVYKRLTKRVDTIITAAFIRSMTKNEEADRRFGQPHYDHGDDECE